MKNPELTSVDLVRCFYDCGLSEVEGMNLLQDQGVISDNCVWAGNVATADIERAIDFIKKTEKTS